MYFSSSAAHRYDGRFTALKTPGADTRVAAQRDPRVAETVSTMLSAIRSEGLPAVRRYAAELDSHAGSLEVTQEEMQRSGAALSTELRTAIELGAHRTRVFAQASRNTLRDMEIEVEPGLVAGYRYLPVQRVGAYLPAGRFPLTASAFMTINVAKAAGVPYVVACTPPQPDGKPNPAVLYAAKRQLFGTVAIDLLAGPSEVAVIADDTADPELVAADLLGQAEHGPDSPAALITTSPELARQVLEEVDRQLTTLTTKDIAGPAWRDHGSITIAEDRETAAALMDDLAPEHLEIQTADDDWYHERLTAYGSLFLGPWSTVAYSDKGMAGTNHVLPTAGGARHSAGLSVSRFLRPLTYQRVSAAATPLLADAVEVISASEAMEAHRATAALRTVRFAHLTTAQSINS
jgi:sulfopropanediol 3-dehydrogenase